MSGWVVDVAEARLEASCRRLDRLEGVLATLVWAVLVVAPAVVGWVAWRVIFG